MIPQEVIDLTNGPYFAYLGTRDKNLKPTIRIVWGMSFKAAEDIITAFALKSELGSTLDNLQQNGQAAITYSNMVSHVAYQLKGRLLQTRLLTPAEVTQQKEYQTHTTKALVAGGYPEEPSLHRIPLADIAIDIKVEKIFNQTPGPGAGKEMPF